MNEEEEFEFMAAWEQEQAAKKQSQRGMLDVLRDEAVASLPGRTLKGAKDILDAGAQGLAHVFGTKQQAEDLDNQLRADEADYQATRKRVGGLFGGDPGFDAARMAGGVVLPGAMASRLPVAATTAGKMAQGSTIGGITAAMQPVLSEGDFLGEKATQIGWGSLFGGVAPPVTGAIARVLSPRTSQEAKLLMSEGVRPTMAQTLGGVAKGIEEKSTSMPIIGDAIAASQRKAVDEFNIAALNRVLAPIGKSLPKTANPGSDALRAVRQTVTDQYDDVLKKTTFMADTQFANEIGNLRNAAQLMVKDRAEQFDRILENSVFHHMTPAGRASGESFKLMTEKLGKHARAYMGSPDPDQRNLGAALLEAQKILRDTLSRSNPQQAAALKSADEAWANLVRVQTAAGMQGAKDRVFSPAQLASAVRSTDKTLRKRAFSEGTALMQDLATAGEKVLSSKYPDSGTAGRALLNAGALSAGTLSPGLLAGGLTTAGLLSPAMRPLMLSLVTRRPDVARDLAEALVRTPTSTIGALAAPGMLRDE